MPLVVLDFETYYNSKTFTLSKMTMEEYIRDPRFEVIGVGIRVDNTPARWYVGADVAPALAEIDWGNTVAVAHNALFDAAILRWVYGHKPLRWWCTMKMARAMFGLESSVSLKAVAERFGIGQKGDEVLRADGKRLADFTPQELEAYGRYCINDVELTARILSPLFTATPPTEREMVAWTVEQFADPVLDLDVPLLERELTELRTKLEKARAETGMTVAALRSDGSFAAALEAVGVDPPRKISPTTGQETWAFSKQDTEFMDLLEHDDPRVVALVEARLGNKTSIAETRLERFIGIGKRGKLPVPLAYAGAMTTKRWGGTDSINLQNLPKKGGIRHAIKAPRGAYMVAGDLSQIELRVNAWQSGQQEILDELTRPGGDTYSAMASSIYGYAVTKEEHPVERFVGKTAVLGCFAADTLVLTDRGAVPIVDVTKHDRLWDGVEWVRSEGVVSRGVKVTVEFLGVRVTPDHRVLGLSGWRPAQARGESIRSLASAIVRGLWSFVGMQFAGGPLSVTSAAAIVAARRTPPSIIGGRGVARDALRALGSLVTRHGALSVTRSQVSASGRTSSPKFSVQPHAVYAPVVAGRMSTASSTLGVRWLQRLWPALRARATSSVKTPFWSISAASGTTCARESEVSLQSSLGHTEMSPSAIHGTHSSSSLLTRLTSMVGVVRCLGSFWIGSTARAVMALTTAGGWTQPRLLETYDIAFAGPRNRFTIIAGGLPVIVHNCGYGCGATRFASMLRVSARQQRIALPDESDEFAATVVGAYRAANQKIVRFWREAQDAIPRLAAGVSGSIGPYHYTDGKLFLPNGQYLYYPNLRRKENDEWVYDKRLGRTQVEARLYGPKLVENITQAVARLPMCDAIARLWTDYGRWCRPVFTVHDEVVTLWHESVPKEEAMAAVKYALTTIKDTTLSQFFSGLPLAAEVKAGTSYGEVK